MDLRSAKAKTFLVWDKERRRYRRTDRQEVESTNEAQTQLEFCKGS